MSDVEDAVKRSYLGRMIRWLKDEKNEGHKGTPPSPKWAGEESAEHKGATGKEWAKQEAKEHAKPTPGLLGVGMATDAARKLKGRRAQIEEAIDKATE